MSSLIQKGYKCYGECGLKYSKDKLILHKRKNVCLRCYEKIKQKIIKDNFTCCSCSIVFEDENDLVVYGRDKKKFCSVCIRKEEQSVFERNKLYASISNIFGLDKPTGLIMRQIKNFKQTNGISYKNMYFTLDYITKVKGIELQLKYGVGLIGTYHNEMLNYYADIKQKRESAKNFNPTKSIDVVRIKKPVFDDSYRQKKMIDMESLLK